MTIFTKKHNWRVFVKDQNNNNEFTEMQKVFFKVLIDIYPFTPLPMSYVLCTVWRVKCYVKTETLHFTSYILSMLIYLKNIRYQNGQILKDRRHFKIFFLFYIKYFHSNSSSVLLAKQLCLYKFPNFSYLTGSDRQALLIVIFFVVVKANKHQGTQHNWLMS